MKPYEKRLKLDDFINQYCSEKIVDKPGEKSIYSNVEYIILTKIIENITKKPYESSPRANSNTFKNESFWNDYTQHYPKGLVIPILSMTAPRLLQKMNRILPKISFGAGAMYSTAEDLFKFDQGIFQEKLLKPATQNYLLKPNPNLGMLLLVYGTPMDMEHLANLLFIVLAGF
jgi:CubicO group peptidase (beta-lactamase class C family)